MALTILPNLHHVLRLYHSFSEAQGAIIRYITGYYSAIRPHWYNGSLTPNESERLYYLQSNAVASIR
ncbi:hypothetical protein EWM60_07510 [Candidatus Erwinia dacicola]|nr:hypothetical protein [Candidatus Erwinia dacicola]NJD85314.1 hypothetical protein [Candidatus Erwinia dacicola]